MDGEVSPQVIGVPVVVPEGAARFRKTVPLNTDSLNGLRALAILHIVLGHFSAFTNWTDSKDVHDNNFSDGLDLGGGISMGLFYIISGFVMQLGYGSCDAASSYGCFTGECSCCCCCWDCCCGGLCATQAVQAPADRGGAVTVKKLDTRAFLWKRFARLAPLWYLGNLIALPLHYQRHRDAPTAGWVSAVLSIFGLTSWSMVLYPPARHLWTISTMTFFYQLFPALCHRVEHVRPQTIRGFALVMYGAQFILFALSVAAPLLAVLDPRQDLTFEEAWMPLYFLTRVFPPFRLPIFVMGQCAARQCELEAAECEGRTTRHRKKAFSTALWMAVFALVIIAATVDNAVRNSFLLRMLEWVIPPAFFQLVVALAYPADQEPPSCLHALLASRPLKFFADISLAVYVVHMTIVYYIILGFGDEEWEDSKMPSWGPAVGLPASLLLGWLLTKFFEKPVARALQRWVLGSPGAQTSTA